MLSDKQNILTKTQILVPDLARIKAEFINILPSTQLIQSLANLRTSSEDLNDSAKVPSTFRNVLLSNSFHKLQQTRQPS